MDFIRRMRHRSFLAVLGALTLAVAALPAAEVKMISPADAAKLVNQKKAVLIDCREPSEWAESGVAAPATLLPKSDFDGEQKLWREFLQKHRGKQIIVYCRTGRRSGAVAETLAKQGYTAANAGGFKDWTNAGLPTRKYQERK